MLDMTSLKTCLDPEALPVAEAIEEEEAGEEREAKVSCILFILNLLAQARPILQPYAYSEV